MADKLTGATEDNVLTVLCFNKQHASRVAMEITPDLFSNRNYQKIAEEAIKYIDKYNEPPGTHIRDLMEKELTHGETAGLLLKIIDAMESLEANLKVEFVLDKLEEFVESSQLRNAINNAADLLHQGKLDEAKDALHVPAQTQQGSSGGWFNDEDEWSDFMDRNDSEILSSGIRTLDERDVRPVKGEMMLFVAPPKSGKCIAGHELVLLPNGQRKPIADVVRDRDPEVVSFDEKNGIFVRSPVAEYWENGVRKCVRLITKSGRQIITTEEHLYLTPHGWVPVEDLAPGDFVAVPKRLHGLGHQTEELPKLRLLAYLIADGSLRKDISYTKQEPIVRADFETCLAAMGDTINWHPRGHGYVRGIKNGIGHNKTRPWLESLGLLNKKSRDKFVPDFVFGLTDYCIAEFLKALFSSDGSIFGKPRPSIEYTSASARLVEDIHHLLTRLGIVSRLRYFDASFKGRKIPGYAKLLISDTANLNLYMEKIGFIGPKVNRAAELIDPDRKQRKRQWIPLSADAFYDMVVDIIPDEEQETFDIGIADHHNFVAANMIVHNSWFGINVGKTNLIEHGRKVLHISLENSLKVTKQRYTQAFLSMTRKQVQTIRVPTYRRDDLGGFIDIKFEQFSPKSLENTSKAELNKRLTRYRKRGQLYVQHFPDGSLTVPQLDRFLDTLEKTHKFIPDIVILDFAEKMAIDVNNLRIATGRLFIALRGIAVRRHFALVTMSQGNRASISAKLVRGSQVAEDISKLGHADITLTFSRTPEEKEEHLARVMVDGARNVEDSWIALITQSYELGQFCLDDVYFGKQAQSEVARLTGEEGD